MKRIIISALSLLAVGAAEAQLPKAAGGALFDHDVISAAAAIGTAQQGVYGTARSMAMGGAFTSLGGDLASTAVNPAGLGMYRHNDLGITFSVNIASSSTPGTLSYNNISNTKGRFAINNIGIALKVYEGTGKIAAVNFGVSYNKVADFNYHTAFNLPTQTSTFATALRDIAQNHGLNVSGGHIYKGGSKDYDMNPYYWGNVMGFYNFLINAPAGIGTNWVTDTIGANALVGQYYDMVSQGSAGETSLSLGVNYDNKLYFGASLDITNISRRCDIYYGEEFSYPGGSSGTDYQLDYFNYNQVSKMSGIGVRAKFGVTYRPTEAVRIGFAVHTPTYYSIQYQYQGQMSAEVYSETNPLGYHDFQPISTGWIYYPDETSYEKNDSGNLRWALVTPTKLMVGASCTLGNRGVVSVDYEYDAYKALNFNRMPYSADNINDVNDYLHTSLRGAHNIRAGVEFKPFDFMAIRLGGGYFGYMLDDSYTSFTEPVVKSAWFCTGGLGFSATDSMRIDLAYSYKSDDSSSYQLFFSQSTHSATLDTKYTRHNIAMSMAWYF